MVVSADTKGLSPWVVLGAAGVLGICLAGGAIGSVAAYQWLDSPRTPDVPAPVPALDLGDLVAAEARPKYAGFYTSLAAISGAGEVKTTGQFREAQRIGAAALKGLGQLPDAPALNEPISKRIEAAIGLDDQALTDESRQALAAVLRQIAGEFK